MKKKEVDPKEKIILPKNLQREMIKFFLNTSVPKIAEANKLRQQTSEISSEGC
ncbi:MAG: hypothetical protein FWB80_13780 [Defluviitaleaceae bacterium]|nr:hypothetical protein [Defluviitaleaceae bacterium]